MLVSCTDDLSVGAEAVDGGEGGTMGSGDAASIDGAVAVDGAMITQDGGPDSSSSADADAALPLEDGGCGVVIAQEGAVVPIQVMNDAVPQESGGILSPGTYVLTSYKVHGAGPQGTGNTRETIVLTGTNAAGAMKRLSEISDSTGAFTAHGPLGEHFTFMGDTITPVMFRSEDCPNNSVNQTVQYTVSGTTLTLLDEDTSTERTYVRVN